MSSNRLPKFKTIGELRKVFNDKPFEFNALVNRIELTVEDCYARALLEPCLNEYYFQNDADQLMYQEDNSQEADGQDEPNEDRSLQVSPDVLARLRDARHALRDEGSDPLPECIRLANAVTRNGSATKSRGVQTLREQPPEDRRRSGSRLYKKRKTAVRLEFDDDESFIDDEEVGSPGVKRDERVHLSNLPSQVAPPNSDEDYTPSKKKRRGSQQKKYDGKRPWTAEEKSAILQGVQTYGKGSWAVIKKKYDVLFELRTSGQIKVCCFSLTGDV